MSARATGRHLRYFILPDTPMGSMAERTVIDLRRSIVLAEGADPVARRGGHEPGDVVVGRAPRRRIGDVPRSRVLVLGATGNAGRLAIQVAKHIGARHVVGAGRDPEALATLRDLGADDTVSLAGAPDAVVSDLSRAAADVDVVIDYLWGEPAASAMRAIVTARRDRGAPLTWVQIGSVAGPTAPIPSAALRAARLQIVGSGQGSVSDRRHPGGAAGPRGRDLRGPIPHRRPRGFVARRDDGLARHRHCGPDRDHAVTGAGNKAGGSERAAEKATLETDAHEPPTMTAARRDA